MGAKQQTTQDRQPSGMSIALSWIQAHKKIVGLGCGLLAILVLATGLAWQGLQEKQVTLIVDGEPKQVDTRQSDVMSLLEEQRVELGEEDWVSVSLDESIRDGDTIEVRHAVEVEVTVDGVTERRVTTADTVQAALREWEIALGTEDRVVPSLQAKVKAEMDVSVVRVKTVLEEIEEVVPHEVVTEQDNNLLKGKERIVQEGQDGLVVKKVKQVWEDGQLVSSEVVEENIKQQPENQVVALGTRNPVAVLSATSPDVQTVTKDGVTFGVKKILENVTLTAYDAGVGSTGKSEEHPNYGITYTGTTVSEGRTAAVDPDVIPLGWWFYIEGFGFRKAEDTGSAIKGNKVDVYVESEAEANAFGRKKGHTVYIIGPNPPDLK
ncbi:DUF348 domain-containing protein [Xylanibacillus composti]|uniref:G5 domain-containing protein n=1 Tax=Xylanibacillus composti TaxID=1572762 RepID=A0A8J4M180_9BACL|nr:3D domain-containing protein [Xylanibacillus composti]MDT9725161.1 DUF348 domain-containing protein [Xylanibacillus composti]GIQ67266.1 hypothetical protein XYCOK13_00900 [Xylanibacillus composti]